MPYGNKEMYGAGYIEKQMAKQGEVSDVDESALYREKLEFDNKIKRNYPLTESFPSKAGSKHIDPNVLGKLASSSPHS